MPDHPTYSLPKLARYQHYKNRNPPWIKLYQEFLSDPDLMAVSDGAKWFLAASMLLASRYQNRIRLDGFWLWKQTGGSSAGAILGYVHELKNGGFIEVSCDASNMLATCLQGASAERETERETEGEGDGVPFVPVASRPTLSTPLSSRNGTGPTVRALFEFWKWWAEKPRAKFGPDRQRKVLARLSDGYAPSVIIRAIIGCCDDPFNRGENDRQREFVDLELICRDGSHVERYADQAKEDIVAKAIERFGADPSGNTEAARLLRTFSQA